MDNTENNILIAEFLGFRKVKGIRDENGRYYDYQMLSNLTLIKEQEIEIESEWGYGLVEQDYIFSEDLIFHSDWNWLMEVVEKIETINDNEFIVEISDCMCEITGFEDNPYFKITACGGDKKDSVYNACLQFVSWYNENN